MDNNFAFAYVKLIAGENKDIVSYCLALLNEGQFQLLPVSAQSIEELKQMFESIVFNFAKVSHLTQVTISSDESKIEDITAIDNPLYIKQDE